MAVTRVALRSKAFPEKYVRMDSDGECVTQYSSSGWGKVSTKNCIGPYETFVLERHDDGNVSFKSTVFDNVYLRLSGYGVPKSQNPLDIACSGVVNCQYGCSAGEKFKIVQKKPRTPDTYDGTVGLESKRWPGRFLRMNGDKDRVDVQGVFMGWEEWEILVIG